jgi:hypothetical protein
MSSFKTKNKVKKKELTSRVTLDALHNDKIKQFNQNESVLKKMEMELVILKKKLSLINKKKLKELSDQELDDKFTILDNIRDIDTKIKNIKSKSEDIDYFLDTGSLLFQYYTITNNIANGNVKKNTLKKKLPSANTKSVMEYFKGIIDTSSDSGEDDPIKQQNTHIFQSRANIYDQYMIKTDKNFVLTNDKTLLDICQDCSVEKTLYISDGKLICNSCGEETTILVDSDKPSYKDPPREVS